MNIEIHYKGTQYSAEYTITYNLDTSSEIHSIELIFYAMTLFETGYSLEEVLENIKSTLDIIP